MSKTTRFHISLRLMIIGNPFLIGRVIVVKYEPSCFDGCSKSYFSSNFVVSSLTSRYAKVFPKQIRGPQLNTGNLNWLTSLKLPVSESHREGLKVSASSQSLSSRPMANGEKITAAPCGTGVPSGSVSSHCANLISTGTCAQKN